MTGLFNRRYLIHRLEVEFARARRYRSVVSLAFFDIDQLRETNEAHGQDTGDAVIRLVSDVLQWHASGARTWSVARVRSRSASCWETTTTVALRSSPGTSARRSATAFPPLCKDGVHVRVSAGVSSYPDNSTVHSPDDLIRAAEGALSEAKRRGGNRVYVDEAVLQSDKRLVLVVDPDRRLLELAEDLLTLDDNRVVLSDSGPERHGDPAFPPSGPAGPGPPALRAEHAPDRAHPVALSRGADSRSSACLASLTPIPRG